MQMIGILCATSAAFFWAAAVIMFKCLIEQVAVDHVCQVVEETVVFKLKHPAAEKP